MKTLFQTKKWGFRETIFITVALFLTGTILQYFVPLSSSARLEAPYTVYTAAGMCLLIITAFLALRQTGLILWLSSVPAAVASISYLGILSLAMGFATQTPEDMSLLGIHSLLTTWYFIFALIYFLLTLAMATLKRMVPFRWRNTGFLLNHLGLWIAVFAATVGSGDIKSLFVPLQLHQSSNMAFDAAGKSYRLSHHLRLESFGIDEYWAEPLILQTDNARPLLRMHKPEPGNDSLYRHLNIEIHLHRRIMFAQLRDSIYVESDTVKTCQAFEITAIDTRAGLSARGWISNSPTQPATVKLGNWTLLLGAAEPQRYHSQVSILSEGKPDNTVDIEVNKPHKIGALSLYQYSYDTKQGRWSELSILQAVYDPWIDAVYWGLYMVIAGSLYLLFTRSGETDKTKNL